MGFWTLRRYATSQTWIDILNYVDYVTDDARRILADKLGWRSYGSKHHESVYTRFYQAHILPAKFGWDKRKCHLSSRICSGEITRAEALKELQKPPYPSPELLQSDRAFVLKKLGLGEEEFEKIMSLPVKTYWDYPSYGRLYRDLGEGGRLRALHGVLRSLGVARGHGE
jgi:hypothetical protein